MLYICTVKMRQQNNNNLSPRQHGQVRNMKASSKKLVFGVKFISEIDNVCTVNYSTNKRRKNPATGKTELVYACFRVMGCGKTDNFTCFRSHILSNLV